MNKALRYLNTNMQLELFLFLCNIRVLHQIYTLLVSYVSLKFGLGYGFSDFHVKRNFCITDNGIIQM